MGYPEPRKSANASGVFLTIAVVTGLGLSVLVGGFILLRSFRSETHVATPAIASVELPSYGPTRTYSVDDLTVEIDPQGQTYYRGEPLPLEQIKPLVRQAMMNVSTTGEIVHVVEGCPVEHLERVLAMYEELGITNPGMLTIPPMRTVVVSLDAQGKAQVDGKSVEKVTEEIQPILAKYGPRAKLKIEADPKCPSEAVIKLTKFCRELGFANVRFETKKEHVAEKTE